MRINGIELKLGVAYKFTTLNDYDAVVHEGVVTSFCDRATADTFNDIERITTEVNKSLPPEKRIDIDKLEFFILNEKTVVNGVTQDNKVSFGNLWVKEESFSTVGSSSTGVITVFNIENGDLLKIVNILKEMNYRVSSTLHTEYSGVN